MSARHRLRILHLCKLMSPESQWLPSMAGLLPSDFAVLWFQAALLFFFRENRLSKPRCRVDMPHHFSYIFALHLALLVFARLTDSSWRWCNVRAHVGPELGRYNEQNHKKHKFPAIAPLRKLCNLQNALDLSVAYPCLVLTSSLDQGIL